MALALVVGTWPTWGHYALCLLVATAHLGRVDSRAYSPPGHYSVKAALAITGVELRGPRVRQASMRKMEPPEKRQLV